MRWSIPMDKRLWKTASTTINLPGQWGTVKLLFLSLILLLLPLAPRMILLLKFCMIRPQPEIFGNCFQTATRLKLHYNLTAWPAAPLSHRFTCGFFLPSATSFNPQISSQKNSFCLEGSLLSEHYFHHLTDHARLQWLTYSWLFRFPSFLFLLSPTPLSPWEKERKENLLRISGQLFSCWSC